MKPNNRSTVKKQTIKANPSLIKWFGIGTEKLSTGKSKLFKLVIMTANYLTGKREHQMATDF